MRALLDWLDMRIQLIHIRAKSITTVRELRGSFPKVKRILETEGAVIVSDHGEPKYLLALYTPSPAWGPRAKDYMARLKKFQPRPPRIRGSLLQRLPVDGPGLEKRPG